MRPARYNPSMPEYRCTICERDVTYDGRLPSLYPFCSSRCKLVDLGRWFNEQYTIDRDASPEDVADRTDSEERPRW